jgi:hypothetical protein
MTRFVFTRNLLMVATFLSFASEDVHGMVLPWKKGVIGPCTDYRCNFGAMCIVKNGQPSCECPRCSDEFEPVCGTDFISYQNECRLKQMSCEQRKEVYIKYKDICPNEPTQAPMFTQKPDRLLRVVETQDAELRCRSFGIPKPVITWAKDAQLLSGASHDQADHDNK